MNHDRKTHSLGVYDTIIDARAALNIAKADAARGLFVPPAQRRAARKAETETAVAESMTLREWSEEWLASLEANPDRSKGTIVAYRSVLKNHVVPQLGDVRLVDLTTELVADHLAALARLPSKRHAGARTNGVAPNASIVLRSCINAAVKSRAASRKYEYPSPGAGAGSVANMQVPR